MELQSQKALLKLTLISAHILSIWKKIHMTLAREYVYICR